MSGSGAAVGSDVALDQHKIGQHSDDSADINNRGEFDMIKTQA